MSQNVNYTCETALFEISHTMSSQPAFENISIWNEKQIIHLTT